MAFLLAHLSDPHIGPLPQPRRRELLNKRLTGYLNWKRRATIHNMDVLARIVADMRAHAPDHIAMTGDIMNIGLPAEFPIARAWLETLGDPQRVSFTPGNHDAYVRANGPMIADTFAPWCSSDGETHTRFPFLRVRGEVALIGLSSAIPTAPLLASGELGARQRAEFERMLVETGARGLFRVVMIHHPPWRGGASYGRGLRDAGAFEAIVAKAGAELILHGHNHRLSHNTLPADGRSAPVIGVASASAVPGTPRHRAAWHLYSIERDGERNDGPGWRVEMHVRGAVGAGHGEIEDWQRVTL